MIQENETDLKFTIIQVYLQIFTRNKKGIYNKRISYNISRTSLKLFMHIININPSM